jgi:MOSC domain-containing protein YiiM
MKSYSELMRLWDQAPRPPVGHGAVRFIGVRKGGGVHESPPSAVVTVEGGVLGDRWSAGSEPQRHSQITLMNATVGQLIAHGATPPYESGDNFYVDLDLSEAQVPAGSRIRLGPVLLEVTPQPHRGCARFRRRFGTDALRWVNGKERRHLRLRGVHCCVIEGGVVRVGDAAVVVAAPDSLSIT